MAIIKDSFREAWASRVLWVLLVMVTVFLLGLLPFSYRTFVMGEIRPRDCIDWVGFRQRVYTDGQADAATGAGQIWRTLRPSGREAIEQFASPATSQSAEATIEAFRNLLGELNQMLDQRDLYDPEIWPAKSLGKEARELVEKQSNERLEENELQRLNRLLVEASFPRIMKRSPAEYMQGTYGTMRLTFFGAGTMPYSPDRLERIVNGTMVFILAMVISTIGVFIAILATAPQINSIFDEGSVNLLLSKPISRSALYLSKYLGGCVFIFIVTGYFIVGLVVIAGIRFGVWDWKPLAALPVFVFMFMTYFSITGLASILWKNTIISIAAPILFWCLCFSIGFGKGILDGSYVATERIQTIEKLGEEVAFINTKNFVFLRDGVSNQWRRVAEDKQKNQPPWIVDSIPDPYVRGLAVTSDDKMIALRTVGPFPGMGDGTSFVHTGDRFEDFASERGAVAPAGTLGMYQNGNGELLVVAAEGIFRLGGKLDSSQAPVKILGIDVPFTGSSAPFKLLSPEGKTVAKGPADAAFHRPTGKFAIYSQGTVTLWSPDGEKGYQETASTRVSDNDDQPAEIAIGDKAILLAMESGELHMLTTTDLKPLHAPLKPLEQQTPRLVMSSPAGDQFAVLYQSGYVYLIDSVSGSARIAPLPKQGLISAAAYLDEGEFAIAYQTERISVYDPNTGKHISDISPPASMWWNTYYWGLIPIYSVLPKQRELDSTVSEILNDDAAGDAEDNLDDDSFDSGNLSERQPELKQSSPVISTAIFIVVMLGIGCWLMERHEF